MQLENGMHVRDKKTMDIIEEMWKRDSGIYIKDGMVFRRDPETGKSVEALGSLSKYTPEKCRECAFLIKNPSGRDTLSEDDGELFYKGGCIMKECVEDIIREKRRFFLQTSLGPTAGRRAFKRFKNSMWAEKK